MKTVLTTAEKNARSINWGSEQAQRPHTLSREENDLRDDLETAFVALEGRTNMPRIDGYTGANDNSEEGTHNLVIKGKGFLAGRAQASASVTMTAKTLTINAVRPGTDGNNLTVTFSNTGDRGASVWTVNGNDIACALKAAAGAPNGDFTELNTTLVGTPEVARLITLNLNGNGAIAAAEVSKTSLSGGTGNGLTLTSYQFSNAASTSLNLIGVTDTAITVQDDQIKVAVGEIHSYTLKSHTAEAQAPFSTTVVA